MTTAMISKPAAPFALPKKSGLKVETRWSRENAMCDVMWRIATPANIRDGLRILVVRNVDGSGSVECVSGGIESFRWVAPKISIPVGGDFNAAVASLLPLLFA